MKKRILSMFIATAIMLSTVEIIGTAEIKIESKMSETPKEILEEEQKRHTEKVDKITSAKKIDKVMLSSSRWLANGKYEEYQLETTNADVIQKWVDLIEKMETRAVTFNPTMGQQGYVLSLYIESAPLIVGGGFTDGNVYIDGENNMRVMLTIENYDELRDSFEYLQKIMGFPKSCSSDVISILGHVRGKDKVEIGDALEILKYLAGMKSVIEPGNRAWYAACITGKSTPTIGDALEILKKLAGMKSKVS